MTTAKKTLREMMVTCPCCGERMFGASAIPQHRRGITCILALVTRFDATPIDPDKRGDVRKASWLIEQAGFSDDARGRALVKLVTDAEKMAALLSIDRLLGTNGVAPTRHAVAKYLRDAGVVE